MARGGKTKLSCEQIKLFIERYNDGEEVDILSREFGVSRATGFRYINRGSHKPRHNLSHHPLHAIWTSMRDRCNYPGASSYKWYGGRGIKVCPEWDQSYKAFYLWAINNGYTRIGSGRNKLSLDRIDPDCDYCPENCRWVTQHVQVAGQHKNSRNTSGYKGVYKDKRYGGFIAEITINNETTRLGKYKTAIEAAKARDAHIKKFNLREYPLQVLDWED